MSFPRDKLGNAPWKYISCIDKTLWNKVMSLTTLWQKGLLSSFGQLRDAFTKQEWPKVQRMKVVIYREMNNQENGLIWVLKVFFLSAKIWSVTLHISINALLKHYFEEIFWGSRNCMQSVMPWCLAQCLWNYPHTHQPFILSHQTEVQPPTN